MLATVPSATLFGVEGRPVTVEVHVSNGLPGFTIVGLPDTSCREARDRVRAALLSSGLDWPLRRMTVNLAPSALRKGGAGLDLAIAIALLVAVGVVEAAAVEGHAFVGELGLDGGIRPVTGIVPLVECLTTPAVVVPLASVREASLVGRHTVRGARNLVELLAALRGQDPWPEPGDDDAGDAGDSAGARAGPAPPAPDLADVRGQRVGRWAVEVAAAGGHHLLMIGPPGAGKTMLARRLPGLLPPLDRAAALETTRVHSAAGLPLPPGGLVERPPFRAPHHTASVVALVGGGSGTMRPGEVSLAANGVLFLDELGEMPVAALDALRQPLEEGRICVARARGTVVFPAKVLLVAAMNPCPCGDGSRQGRCRCSDASRARYLRRLSGPLLDRFDLRIPVERPDPAQLVGGDRGEPSTVVAARVVAARQLAIERGVPCNAALAPQVIERVARLTPAANRVLEHRLATDSLTARGLHRVQRVARTVADLAASDVVNEEHVCTALELRAELAMLHGSCAA